MDLKDICMIALYDNKGDIKTLLKPRRIDICHDGNAYNTWNIEALQLAFIKPVDYLAIPGIKNVIFNDPATIIEWEDGTKTVVKCQEGETFDEEKGLAMAIVKKTLGNCGNYMTKFNKVLKNAKR